MNAKKCNVAIAIVLSYDTPDQAIAAAERIRAATTAIAVETNASGGIRGGILEHDTHAPSAQAN